MFYKRKNELLTAPHFVAGPDFELQAESHADYTYPVDGWYWFDTLDEAMLFFAKPSGQVVTIRQAKLALLQAGLLDTIDAFIAQADQKTRIEWEYATEVRRDWPTLLAIQPTLGLTDEQVDGLFALAATL